MMQSIFDGVLCTPEMNALLDARATVQAMMDVEAALARAQARAGLVPPAAAQAIASLCRAELYDIHALVAAGANTGCLAPPVVDKLTETVALFDAQAAAYVHWGASSQDLVDMALALQTRRALRLIETELLQLCAALLALAEQNETLPMLARRQLQPTLVVSLRFKAVGWLAPLLRSAQALRELATAALLLQLGGTAGAQPLLGDAADAVAREMAIELQLGLPESSWPVQRDRWARLGAELGVLCGSLGKLATDLSLLSQPEVDELGVPRRAARAQSAVAGPGRDASSACMPALAAARRAPQRVAALLACMGPSHEGGQGEAQAERAEFVALLHGAHSAVSALARALPLQLHAAQMQHNITLQLERVWAEGLAQLLAPAMGRAAALTQVAALCERAREAKCPLRLLTQQWLAQEPAWAGTISAAQLDAVFDPQLAAARADARVHQALANARRSLQELRSDYEPLAP